MSTGNCSVTIYIILSINYIEKAVTVRKPPRNFASAFYFDFFLPCRMTGTTGGTATAPTKTGLVGTGPTVMSELVIGRAKKIRLSPVT